MEKSKNNELCNVNVIKTMMMILVVLYHSTLFYSNNWFTVVTPDSSGHYLYYIARFINIFSMPSFVFCSGYLFFYLKKYHGKYTSWYMDIKKRFKRLIVPYIFTSILWVIPIMTLFYGFSLENVVNKFLFATSPAQLWFLIMLFGEFLIFYFLSKKLKFSIFEFFVIMAIYLMLVYFVRTDYFQIQNIVYYSIFYYLSGFFIYNREKLLDKLSSRKSLLVVINFFVCAIMIAFVSINFSKMIYEKVSLIVIQLLFVVCVYVNINKSLLYRLEQNKVFNLLEQYSFGIYLFHQQIIHVIIYYTNGLFHPIVISLLCFVESLIISYIMVFIFKKNKITKFIFGL